MKTVKTKDKEKHDKMIKGSIQEEDITTVNIYTPNIGAPQYIRQIQTVIKGDIDSNTIIVGDFNTPLTSMEVHPDPPKKKSIRKQALSDTLDQIDLIFIEHSIQKQQNTHSFQVQIEHSSELVTC